jgi:hypothetical protein
MSVAAGTDFWIFRNNRRAIWRGETAAAHVAPDCRIGQPRPVDFRALLGRHDWFQLPEAVRARFDVAAHDEVRIYPGAMSVRASLAGRLIAQLCRLIGTPLAPFTGEDVPVAVAVHGDGRGGIVWDRTYRFARRAPALVSSTKKTDLSGRLMEVVRCRLGMTLAVSVEDHALHFRSTGYFLALGSLHLPIPGLLTPGAAHVIHADAGQDAFGGRFRFTMAFVHPWLGETFFQTGLFHDPAGA